ncbi:uncharacterized protein EKO05_0004205 [Ascochyta rabiei]|uniref:uncharacterized protein n=1 Tax=Didymella rabiei TaxID=5454 RepID=UPI00220D7CF3|nr:uncharacterized protein EKO05_0004205 [Ascochyta rabiei]UPX13706.1 hypothetical protein EKO05_0004205 [Ascochyta rabiei]
MDNHGTQPEETTTLETGIAVRKMEGQRIEVTHCIHDQKGAGTAVGIDGVTRGGMKTATKIEHHTSRKGQEIIERVVTEVVMIMTEKIKDLMTEIEENKAPLPDRRLERD